EMSKRMDSLRIPLEVSLVRLSHDRKSQNPILKEKEAVKEQVVSIEKKPQEPPKPVMNITLDNIKDAWQNVIDSLSRVKISAATYLSEGEPFKLSGNLLTIAFPKSHSLHKESLERRENREMIEKNLTEALNVPLRVSFVLSADAKPRLDDSGNTFIRSVMDVFGGRVVKED
ncbi:MAG: hypothetical protein PHS12_05625, partial [Candidatus Omnitrophica bacterium]|nr:hypothetical protein [Candidatus Omnitrophota bacterium]